MVLSLKAWKSRSLPGLPRTGYPPHDVDCILKPPFGAASSSPDPEKGTGHLWSCPPQMKKAAAGDRGGFFVWMRADGRRYSRTSVANTFCTICQRPSIL